MCDELKEKLLCSGCVGERFLSAWVEEEGAEGKCSYCEELASAVTLEDISKQIETAFEKHYSRTANEPNSLEYAMMKDDEISYDWEREGEPTVYAIMNAAATSEEVAQDIQKILEDKHLDYEASSMGVEGEFSEETHYEEVVPNDYEWEDAWDNFEKTIKTESRFFSRTAAAQLGDLFDQIDTMKTRQGGPLVIETGPGTKYEHLFRARVFQSDEKLKTALIRPDKELSAPPDRFASSGRMNARGISVFYGATSISTALAEVRPPVGSQVAVARFDIIRPLRLLDLTALGEIHESGSIFDPNYAYRLGRMMFLRKLSNRIACPVMPDDQEFEYLPTQAIADYLATEGKVPLDGILFPSVQVDGNGLNAVLFHKASRCRELSFPEGTDFRASTYAHYEDGIEPEYRVIEEVPPEEDQTETDSDSSGLDPFDDYFPHNSHDDDRVEALSIDLKSVNVHLVKAVSLNTEDFGVIRHRWTKSKPQF